MNDDFIDIVPFSNNTNYQLEVPGSKSISNRALILAVLNTKEVELQGILDSQDVNIMMDALVKLGVNLKHDSEKNSVKIKGCGGVLPVKKAIINVGNAGTVARFLTALLSLQKGGEYSLDGCDAMRKRPMQGLLDALKSHGTEFNFEMDKNCFPFNMKTNSLSEEPWEIDASESSQILSAILLIAPLINGVTEINLIGHTVSKPFVRMTLEMMQQFMEDFYVDCSQKSRFKFPFESYSLIDNFYRIEPDATAASYFLSAPLSVGGQVTVKNLHHCRLQGDIDYCDVIKNCGLSVRKTSNGVLSMTESQPSGGSYDFNDISDTFLTLAALSPLLQTPLKISGIAHTRKQETDRLGAMAIELRKMGQHVEETVDTISITPNLNKLFDLAPFSVETYEDHRFSMSFAILGSHDLFKNNKSWLRILDPNCCAKTFPHFFHLLDEFRKSF